MVMERDRTAPVAAPGAAVTAGPPGAAGPRGRLFRQGPPAVRDRAGEWATGRAGGEADATCARNSCPVGMGPDGAGSGLRRAGNPGTESEYLPSQATVLKSRLAMIGKRPAELQADKKETG